MFNANKHDYTNDTNVPIFVKYCICRYILTSILFNKNKHICIIVLSCLFNANIYNYTNYINIHIMW